MKYWKEKHNYKKGEIKKKHTLGLHDLEADRLKLGTGKGVTIRISWTDRFAAVEGEECS